MGDRRRFSLFADLIEQRFPNEALRIADVASGNGALRASLHIRGYRNVEGWDVRRRQAKGRQGYVRKLFSRSAPSGYELVVGMHPDGGTDHIIDYAGRHRVPFLVCPCCTIPGASQFWGWQQVLTDYDKWVRHLEMFAARCGLTTERVLLPMSGRNLVLCGNPS